MIILPLHTILRLLGNESKVHLFPTILFQEMLPTRVKAHSVILVNVYVA